MKDMPRQSESIECSIHVDETFTPYNALDIPVKYFAHTMKKTRIYCPGCKLLTISNVEDEMGSTRIREKRVSMPGHIDIQLFQRIRHCTHCGHKWKTAEVDYALLEELTALRTAFDTWLPIHNKLRDGWNTWIQGINELSTLITLLGSSSLPARWKRFKSKRHQAAIGDVIRECQAEISNNGPKS